MYFCSLDRQSLSAQSITQSVSWCTPPRRLKNFYNTTGGASWSLNTNWDIGATSQCGWVDQAIPTGWPYVAPPVSQPLGPACIYKDPCSWNTKWHGVGCVDPCYAPTDGDNCVFGRVTMLDLVCRPLSRACAWNWKLRATVTPPRWAGTRVGWSRSGLVMLPRADTLRTLRTSRAGGCAV
jgi:hypothetical protein